MKPYLDSDLHSHTRYLDNDVIKFSPRLYIQRYDTVMRVLNDFSKQNEINVLTEFGCNNMRFLFKYLLQSINQTNSNVVNQVDLDDQTLQHSLQQFRSYDCVKGKEGAPITAKVYQGNMANKDRRLRNSDAVVGIEVIEHMFDEDLKQFPSNVFGYMRPKLVVFTTPNHDYNVLFNKKNIFRDADHKFEFTRQQFLQWARSITREYPIYECSTYGIGKPPPGKEYVGYASQMAIFRRMADSDFEFGRRIRNRYRFFGSFRILCRDDDRSFETKVYDCTHCIDLSCGDHYPKVILPNDCSVGCHYITLMPFSIIMDRCKEYCDNEEVVLRVLAKMDYPNTIRCSTRYLVLSDDCDLSNCIPTYKMKMMRHYNWQNRSYEDDATV